MCRTTDSLNNTGIWSLTELASLYMVDVDNRAVINPLRNECRMSDPCVIRDLCIEVFQHEIHVMVPFWKSICCLYIVYRNGDGDSCLRRWMGMRTIWKVVAGIRVGMRVLGMVGNGYKYLSPCSFLVSDHPVQLVMTVTVLLITL